MPQNIFKKLPETLSCVFSHDILGRLEIKFLGVSYRELTLSEISRLCSYISALPKLIKVLELVADESNSTELIRSDAHEVLKSINHYQ